MLRLVKKILGKKRIKEGFVFLFIYQNTMMQSTKINKSTKW